MGLEAPLKINYYLQASFSYLLEKKYFNLKLACMLNEIYIQSEIFLE